MAKATLVTIFPAPPPHVELILTLEEAGVLSTVLGNVGGDAKKSYRKYAAIISDALRISGVGFLGRDFVAPHSGVWFNDGFEEEEGELENDLS